MEKLRDHRPTGAVDVPAMITTALDAGYAGVIGIEAFSRSVLPPAVGDMLAIWREPYDDGLALAADAMALIEGVLLERVLVEGQSAGDQRSRTIASP